MKYNLPEKSISTIGYGLSARNVAGVLSASLPLWLTALKKLAWSATPDVTNRFYRSIVIWLNINYGKNRLIKNNSYKKIKMKISSYVFPEKVCFGLVCEAEPF